MWRYVGSQVDNTCSRVVIDACINNNGLSMLIDLVSKEYELTMVFQCFIICLTTKSWPFLFKHLHFKVSHVSS